LLRLIIYFLITGYFNITNTKTNDGDYSFVIFEFETNFDSFGFECIVENEFLYINGINNSSNLSNSTVICSYLEPATIYTINLPNGCNSSISYNFTTS